MLPRRHVTKPPPVPVSPAGGVPLSGPFGAPVALMVMAGLMQIAFASWSALQYNFAAETLGFTGFEIGVQQSIREIPGFLSFAAVFLLFLLREQVLAYVSLVLLGLSVAATGWFPTALGFYLTTFIGSIGFHYYETMHQSLTLQWLLKDRAPVLMGRILGAAGAAQLAAYALIFIVGRTYDVSYATLFAVAGGVTVLGTLVMWRLYPIFPEGAAQTRRLILRRRYWLYYALTFMSGARRQIFLVFASWMMVERFGYAFHEIAALFFLNALLLMVTGPLIGSLVARLGERRTLMVEYLGLIVVFTAYAFVSDPYVAVALYLADHALFAMAIALKTYFQKIAEPSDIAATTGVAFTINHVAAVFVPVLFGLVWLWSPAAVFLAGAAMGGVSLVLSTLVPLVPQIGHETTLSRPRGVLAPS